MDTIHDLDSAETRSVDSDAEGSLADFIVADSEVDEVGTPQCHVNDEIVIEDFPYDSNMLAQHMAVTDDAWRSSRARQPVYRYQDPNYERLSCHVR